MPYGTLTGIPGVGSRRHFLAQSWNGIGAMALASMLHDEACAAAHELSSNPLAPRDQHMPRKAKHCIFLFMQGGVSQVDSFEYKPLLDTLHGKPIPVPTDLSGELQGRLSFYHECMASPFQFAQHGESGHYFSELFPHLARHADRLAFIHGIKTDNQNHGPATLQVTTGTQLPGGASVGSWIHYGLGTVNQNMPGYVVIQDQRGAPVNGSAVWANGYLPASYQGTLLRTEGTPILNLSSPHDISPEQQRRELDILRRLNERHLAETTGSELEARINAYELAYRMQQEAPHVVDLSDEPEHIRKLYGLDQPDTAGFGRQCLLARRMVENGVRYTLLIHGVQIGKHSWDDHGGIEAGFRRHAREVDQPVGALLTDLDQRGLLNETLVVWTSEMGRTPFRNGEVGIESRTRTQFVRSSQLACRGRRGRGRAGR